MEVSELVRKYLKEAKLMQLATAANDQPWVCSVWSAADDDLNIYWFSSISRRHSQEIKKNPKVAAAFALPHSPQDPPRGLQLEGIAEKLSADKDIIKARSVYEGRVFDAKTIDELIAHPEKPHQFYRIRPTLFVLFDAVNFPEESRREWKPNS